MRQPLFIILLFLQISVGAQTSDTLYFDQKEKEVKKGEKFHLFKVTTIESEKKIITWYFKDGKLFSQYVYLPGSNLKDSFYQLDYFGDTLKTIKYSNDKVKKQTYFLEGEKNLIVDYVNDSTYYLYGISKGKYVVSKSKFVGEKEYVFHGKDSVLNLEKFSLAFRKKQPNSEYVILKYKMLPWVFGEDIGMNYTLGVEYTFSKVHSVEFTATYFDWDKDQEDGYGNPLPSIYEVRRSLQLGYRYYLPKFKKQKSDIRIFLSPYVRFSKWKEYYAEGAVTNFFQNESWNYISGINLGFCFELGDISESSYTEVFFGPTYFSRYTEEGFTNNNLIIHQNYTTQKFGFRLGMNFCGLISRKKSREIY